MTNQGKLQTKKEWVLKEENPTFKSEKINPVIIKLLSKRGISTEKEAFKFLSPDYNELVNVDVSDLEKGAETIISGIYNNDKICIYGDYDVDGISSIALLYLFLKEIGAEVTYYIPNRVDEGYGLNKKAIQKLSEEGVKLLISVDCGTNSVEEIKYAYDLGLKVVVTDHHSIAKNNNKDLLPKAEAVINPRRIDSHCQEELAGVGVVFFLVKKIIEKIDYKKGQEKWLLDLVALGTICDVVPLVGINRILARYGLMVLNKTKRVGLKTLIETTGLNKESIDSYRVGFVIGPRLNAAGRMAEAEFALRLLTTNNENEAKELVNKLNSLNLERQEITEKIFLEAQKLVDASPNKLVHLLANKDWPAGVVGIVASKLTEKYHRPILIMEDLGTKLKGSARSIKGFNIIEALESCKEELLQFGGHKFAAGFKLDKEKLTTLDEKINTIAFNQINESDLIPQIYIEQEINESEFTKEFFDELKQFEPFGQGNPRPMFILREVKVIERKLVGNPPIHLKVKFNKNGKNIDGMLFGYGDSVEGLGEKLSLIGYIEENNWNGISSIEFKIVDIKSE